jgi:ADP-heptose:LPS heptosyltransferase
MSAPALPLGLPRGLVESMNRGGAGLSVLVLRLSAMGDIVRTLPAVRILRARLPQARIHWILEQSWSVVLEGHPDLDGLLPVPRKQWEAQLRNPLQWGSLGRGLREFRSTAAELAPDLLLEFHGNLRSGLLARMTNAPVRLGYAGHQQKEGNHRFTTHHAASGDRRAPRMERNLDLVRALGLSVPESLPACDLPAAEAGQAAADEALAAVGIGDRPFAVISPGASRSQAYKKPPPNLLAAVCGRLADRGVISLVVWGPGEEDDASAVAALDGRAVLAPATRIPALLALLTRARLFVGGDSGPLHLACACGCPVLGLYGPTDPQVNRPWGVPHRVVHPPGRCYTGIKRLDREAGSFEGLRAEDVVRSVDPLLATRAF